MRGRNPLYFPSAIQPKSRNGFPRIDTVLRTQSSRKQAVAIGGVRMSESPPVHDRSPVSSLAPRFAVTALLLLGCAAAAVPPAACLTAPPPSPVADAGVPAVPGAAGDRRTNAAPSLARILSSYRNAYDQQDTVPRALPEAPGTPPWLAGDRDSPVAMVATAPARERDGPALHRLPRPRGRYASVVGVAPASSSSAVSGCSRRREPRELRIRDSDLAKRHRGRVTVDDQAPGASPSRG